MTVALVKCESRINLSRFARIDAHASPATVGAAVRAVLVARGWLAAEAA